MSSEAQAVAIDPVGSAAVESSPKKAASARKPRAKKGNGPAVLPMAAAQKGKSSKAKPKGAAKKAKTRKAKPKASKKVSEERGGAVGYLAKSVEDVPWTPKKVSFYRALKKIGGSGTSAAIAEASEGEVSAGLARHFGYHGVGGKLISVEQHEGVRGFTFTLTTAGKKLDLRKVLKEQEE